MRVSVEFDARELIAKVPNADRRIAFGVAAAINDTLLRLQGAERTRVLRQFTVRRNRFIERMAAVIKPFASARQGRPFGEIAVGQRPRLLLSVFEAGGERLPFKGKRVAVPLTGSAARPSFASTVPAKLEFRRLGLRKTRAQGGTTKSGKQRRARGGHGVRFGLEGTYQIPGVGVFQRRDSGPPKLIYAFIAPPRLKPRLGFIELALRVGPRWFALAANREVQTALRRAGFGI